MRFELLVEEDKNFLDLFELGPEVVVDHHEGEDIAQIDGYDAAVEEVDQGADSADHPQTLGFEVLGEVGQHGNEGSRVDASVRVVLGQIVVIVVVLPIDVNGQSDFERVDDSESRSGNGAQLGTQIAIASQLGAGVAKVQRGDETVHFGREQEIF